MDRDGGRPLGSAPPPAGGVDLTLPGDGITLGATRWPGAGPTVVLLHGLSSQRRFWNLVVPYLAGRDRLALDLRGHGDSDRPAGGYDLTTVAADVRAALAAAGVDRPALVGHSWGGAVAATAAARTSPSAVVLIDGGAGTPGGPEPDRDATRRRLQPPRIAMPPVDVERMVRGGALQPWWTPAHAAAVLPIFEVSADGLARPRLPFERHMQVLDGLLDYRPERVLPSIGCPVWVVACEPVDGDGNDERRADTLARAAGLLARPRLFRWMGAVHDVPLQWPALVAGLIGSAVDEAAAHAPAARRPQT